jgi:hypothetical protein
MVAGLAHLQGTDLGGTNRCCLAGARHHRTWRGDSSRLLGSRRGTVPQNDPTPATFSRLPSTQGATCRAHKGPDGEATPAEPRSPPQGPQPIGRECSPDMKRLANSQKRRRSRSSDGASGAGLLSQGIRAPLRRAPSQKRHRWVNLNERRSYRVGRALRLDFRTVVVRPAPRAFSASRMVFRALLSHEALPLRSLGGSVLICISIWSSAISHTGSTGGAAVGRRAVDLRAAGMGRDLITAEAAAHSSSIRLSHSSRSSGCLYRPKSSVVVR